MEVEKNSDVWRSKKLSRYHAEYCWSAFSKWAEENGIGTHPDDWEPWYRCFIAGWNARVVDIGEFFWKDSESAKGGG